MNTPRHYHLKHLAAVSGICCLTILAGCAVPLGSHYGHERVYGERICAEHGTLEQIVARTHFVDYYNIITVDNFGRQSTSSERYFLKRGGEYTPLPFLNGKWGSVAQDFRPIEGTILWMAVREDKVADVDYENLTVILFGEKGVRRKIPLRMVKRSEFVFGSGNRSVEIELRDGRAVLDLTNGDHILVPRANGVQQKKW